MGEPVIRRLLAEVSWEGRLTRFYHDGGRGRENVLSAEVLQALDFLPRTAFLGEVIGDATGADTAREAVITEIEDLVLDFLPGDVGLEPRVQPDALLTGASTFTLVEAKGPKAPAFNPDQLSREYGVLLREAAGRTPLMLLILGSPPPVRVKKRAGLHDLRDALVWELRHREHDGDDPHREEQIAAVDATIAWTTWDRIRSVIDRVRSGLTGEDPSTAAAVRRLAESIPAAVTWHATR